MSFPGIEGKVAIVTGSGGGIGEAYARALANDGARVVVAEIDKEKGEDVAARLRSNGGDATFIHVDVSSPESTAALADAAEEAYGGIDFLVNNAAIFGDMKLDSLLTVDWDYYQKFMAVNMNGALLCSRACFRKMKERDNPAIVNQSSTAGWMGVGYYGLSKAATNSLTHCLARELGPMGVRVNAIAPGPTETEALGKQVPDAFRDQLVSGPPARASRHAS